MLTEDTRQVIRLLAEGKVLEARVFAAAAVEALRRRKQELEAELSLLDGLVTELGARPIHSLPVPEVARQSTANPSLKAEQSVIVQECAEELNGEAPYRIIRSDAIAARVRAKGIEPPSPTGIGLVLAHTGLWERKGRGVYQKKRPG